MTIAQRLSTLLALLLVGVVSCSIVGYSELALARNSVATGITHEVSSLVLIDRIARTLAAAQTDVQDLVEAPDANRRAQALRSYSANTKELRRQFDIYLTEYISDKTDLRLAGATKGQLLQWLSSTEKFADAATAGPPNDLPRSSYAESRIQGERLTQYFNMWADYNAQSATSAGEEAVKAARHSAGMLAFLLALLLVMVAIAWWLTYRRVINPIRRLQASMEGIVGGDYQIEVPFTTAADEAGALARAVDVLKKRAAALDRQRSLKTAADELSIHIHRAANYPELAEKSLAHLMPLLGTAAGRFYLFDPEDDQLHLVAGYGFVDRKPLKQVFALGETLVGQCAAAKTPLSMNDLPDGYIHQIASELGNVSPRALYAQPLMGQGIVLGVIEVASPRPLTGADQELLDALVPVLARALETLRALNIHALLKRSQQQAFELRQSEQELLLQKDELLEQGRELGIARKAAEAASESKSMFLANVSHEIRTPMGAIIGLSDLALKTKLDEKQRDYLRKIHAASVSLLRILNDILDFSKIEAGKLSVEQTSFWLDDVLNYVALLVSERAVEKSLEVTIAVDADVPAGLVGDPVRLGQILTNLAANAVKFTVRGAVHIHISLNPRTGNTKALEPGSRVCLDLTVTDTGIGMTPEETKNVFAAFAQADGSTARKYGGTGLGLAIVKRLVELMDGEVEVKSRSGVGSKFRASLWLGVGARQRSSVLLPPLLAGGRVLVVDDNPRACHILESNLLRLGLRVDTASSASEAYAAILNTSPEDPYRVAFVDHHMPGTDGIGAARGILREIPEKLRPRVILATAFTSTKVREAAERAGVCAFLTKPVTASALADVLAQVFSGDPVATEPEPELKPDLSGVRVLVAEDNAINQQIIVELLTSANAQVQVTSNGQEALNVLAYGGQTAPFHVLLMDLQMPVMDGYAATRAIRADRRYDSLPIVALTAHALTGERRQCLLEGMNEHITKPIHPALLYRTVLQFAQQPESARQTAGRAVLVEDHPGILTDVPDLAGIIDKAQGLYHVGGNAKLYRSLLLEFAEEYSGEICAVRSALANGQTKTAARLAHTIFGVAKTLGAHSLSKVAENLCSQLSSGRNGNLDELLTTFETDLRRVITAIQNPKRA